MAPQEVTIRPARKEDAQAVADIWAVTARQHRAFDEEAWCWVSDAPAQWMESFLDLVDSERMVMLVAEAEGKIAGFAVSEIRNKPDVFAADMEGFVWDVGVHVDYRRRGIGRRLMEETFEEFRRRDVHDVILHVATANLGAVRMYETLGMRMIMHRMYKKL